MYIVILFFMLFFIGCDANLNSFNINIEGTVGYQKNAGISNTNGNTNNNTNTNTNTNTNNTNTNTNNNANTNTNANITNNIGAQLSTATALEISSGTGIPVTGGDGQEVKIELYKDFIIVKYMKVITKIKHSLTVSSITELGSSNDKIGRVPKGAKFIKVYFNKDGDSISKIYEISPAVSSKSSTNRLPKN